MSLIGGITFIDKFTFEQSVVEWMKKERTPEEELAIVRAMIREYLRLYPVRKEGQTNNPVRKEGQTNNPEPKNN